MKKNKKLKIGIDFHGVINKNHDFFCQFSQKTMEQGHEIHVITGGPQHQVVSKLEKMGFKYSKVFAILDFYEQKKQVSYKKDGSFYVEDEVWNSAKAQYCLKEKINIHIDDSPIYLRYFTTPYCKYDDISKKCMLDDKLCLDFNLSTDDLVLHLEEIFLK